MTARAVGRVIRRVACAVSGGVDSAVSALLLKRSGVEVVGVHMINWDHQDEDQSECPNTQDIADARVVCEQLGIEFHVVNFVKEYWNSVFLGLLENYRRGRTIVPDVDCNRRIKFDLLHRFAFDQLDVDAVATGHFVRNRRAASDFLEPGDVLLKGVDVIKDQTYFLARLSSEQLRRSVFPVGAMLKSKVKAIAKEAGLHNVLAKKESMGICFVGKKRNFDDFLAQYIQPVAGGRFVDSESGETLPNVTHSGVHNFTLGKRVSFHNGEVLTSEGIFVSGVDAATQTVYLCRGSHHPVLFATRFVVDAPHWIHTRYAEEAVSGRRRLECRIQRTHPIVHCRVRPYEADLTKLVVEPRIPLRAAMPGQMCVFYMADECLGGAEVDQVLDTLAGRRF